MQLDSCCIFIVFVLFVEFVVHLFVFAVMVHWRLGLSLMLSCCIRRLSQSNIAGNRVPAVATVAANSIPVFGFSLKAAVVI